VAQCDTLHTIIKAYRDGRKVPLNAEHRLMLSLAPDYDLLPLMHKLEAFEHALSLTKGDDVGRVLWLVSRSAEDWLGRRTNYTRSLAVMSMAGYILGLGDRHPSNVMLDRHSSKILHIDFGDCFEVRISTACDAACRPPRAPIPFFSGTLVRFCISPESVIDSGLRQYAPIIGESGSRLMKDRPI
jgi:phosphatidylinositol kinase/protein kinase (PI-3  family)